MRHLKILTLLSLILLSNHSFSSVCGIQYLSYANEYTKMNFTITASNEKGIVLNGEDTPARDSVIELLESKGFTFEPRVDQSIPKNSLFINLFYDPSFQTEAQIQRGGNSIIESVVAGTIEGIWELQGRVQNLFIPVERRLAFAKGDNVILKTQSYYRKPGKKKASSDKKLLKWLDKNIPDCY